MNQTGLTSAQAEELLQKIGPNDVEEKKIGFVKMFLAPLYSPISLMLLAAAGLSFVDGRVFDFYFILGLYFVNYSIQKWQEFKADRAIQELRDKLSFEVQTLRDNAWVGVNAKKLVPGDHFRLGLGSIIPADAKIIIAKNLSVNEAVLTGESLPKDKKSGEEIFSGAFITAGSLEAEVTAIGKNTKFGKTIFSIEQSTEKSILEKDVLSITWFLTIIAVVSVLILSTALLLKGYYWEELLTLDLSLVIAGIPVALPAVMAIILSIGASGLAKKSVIVRRLSALQDLANVNLLLTDKTGTLTKNQISVVNVISYQGAMSTDDVIELAYNASSVDTPDAIDSAIAKKFKEIGRKSKPAEILNFVPFDSERKRSTALIKKDGKKILLSMGAPQIIKSFDDFNSLELKEKFEADIGRAAIDGFRALAIATNEESEEEKNMKIVGLLFLADPLEEGSKETISFMMGNGIDVKMVTGDNKLIAERIAKELDLSGDVISAEEVNALYKNKRSFEKELKRVAVFAEIMPQDKYELVVASRKKHIVASTGDGINDLPALKAANVGIAAAGAVSALKSLADIVLLGRGLEVIKDAILESRKIFVRLYNYTVYRISESFRLIITILILGLISGSYPLLPLQIILLAFLNDLPIITLAYDRVKILSKPAEINIKERFVSSILFGLVGVLNSVLMFFFMANFLHLSLPVIQTMFFLKLTVSGHALIFVAHTKERWFKFLPSKTVIIATVSTQIIATVLAITGFMMPVGISPLYAFLVWTWALFWMQISELTKDWQIKLMKQKK